MKELFERTGFLLNGGVLSLISDRLAEHAKKGIILRPSGMDMTVMEAFGTDLKSLFLEGRADEIESSFPSSPLRDDYDWSYVRLAGGWPWGIRLRGRRWTVYILLSEVPSKEVLCDLPAFAGLIDIWQKHHRVVSVEERLSRLAYMVLATKSTLASIFEPMNLEYFAAFLRDVMTESLFPSRLSILLDRGGELSHLCGERLPMPTRSGLFARSILSPALVPLDEGTLELVGRDVFEELGEGWSAILPIIGEDERLFCLLRWEDLPGEEELNFIELLGNVASKALSLAAMREENEQNLKIISRRVFLLNALYEAGLKFLEQTTKEALLLRILDVFAELAHSSRTILVAWQPHAGGYVLFASKEEGVVQRTGRPIGFPAGEMQGRRPESFPVEDAERMFGLMEASGLALPEILDGMERVYPLWEEEKLAAFIVVSAPLEGTAVMDVDTLEILARSASSALPGREWESSRLASGKYLNVAALVHWESERIRGEIAAAGGSPVLIKGPAEADISSEQERLCRLVVRMGDSTVCVADGATKRLEEEFPAKDGWLVRKFPAGPR
ncbi:MAG: hypothetical protein GX181_07700 [Synergistaceae bacterium]|nr:hypothetical protein [Synergistota bacterium]NLM71825.1 hypothetical protein [Synergistaceae bacterium]